MRPKRWVQLWAIGCWLGVSAGVLGCQPSALPPPKVHQIAMDWSFEGKDPSSVQAQARVYRQPQDAPRKGMVVWIPGLGVGGFEPWQPDAAMLPVKKPVSSGNKSMPPVAVMPFWQAGWDLVVWDLAPAWQQLAAMAQEVQSDRAPDDAAWRAMIELAGQALQTFAGEIPWAVVTEGFGGAVVLDAATQLKITPNAWILVGVPRWGGPWPGVDRVKDDNKAMGAVLQSWHARHAAKPLALPVLRSGAPVFIALSPTDMWTPPWLCDPATLLPEVILPQEAWQPGGMHERLYVSMAHGNAEAPSHAELLYGDLAQKNVWKPAMRWWEKTAAGLGR